MTAVQTQSWQQFSATNVTGCELPYIDIEIELPNHLNILRGLRKRR